MASFNLGTMIKNVGSGISGHRTVTAISLAGVGYIATVFLAVRATKKSIAKIEEVQKELSKPENNEHADAVEPVQLTKKEVVSLIWKYYIGTVCLGTASTLLLVYAGASHEKQNKAWVAAMALSEATAKEFRDAVAEKIGDEGMKEVQEKIIQKRCEDAGEKDITTVASYAPPSGVGPDGKQWIYEPIQKRFIYTSEDEIELRHINRLNIMMDNDGYVTLGTYFDELGEPGYSYEGYDYDEDIGWSKDRTGYISVGFRGIRIDGKSYLAIVHHSPPRRLFDREKR